MIILYFQICDKDKFIRSLTIHPGFKSNKEIWQDSLLQDYMCQLRSDEQIKHEEGKYCLIGKPHSLIVFIYFFVALNCKCRKKFFLVTRELTIQNNFLKFINSFLCVL